MIDMAVGIVIATAFNNVLNTLVKKVIMPPLSILTDNVNMVDRKYVLREAIGEANEVAIGYGELIEALVDFTIISFSIFVVIKFINRFKRKSQDPKDKEVATPKDIEILSNIEVLMMEQNKLLQSKK